jgi:hypothetical protein
VNTIPEIANAFVTLLLMPLLGVTGLVQKRALPVLAWTLGLWGAFGVWALVTEHTFEWSEERFLRGWLFVLGLGLVFLLVAWLRNQRKVSPWIKIALGGVTITLFLRGLFLFAGRYV